MKPCNPVTTEQEVADLLRIHIRNNQTGEVRTYQDDVLFSCPVFWWTIGNGSCDCNREIYFQRARGEEPDLDADTCSEGRYSVILEDADTGRELHREFESFAFPVRRTEP